MATPSSFDSNIVDAETINWRIVVYPVVAAIILLLGGFGYYYYQLNERAMTEADARALLIQAKTPEELIKVADQFSTTDQAALALLGAANKYFAAKNFDTAIHTYQRAISSTDTPDLLRDSAQLGLASAQEASGKIDEAINAYLVVAHRGKATPYAPFAYISVARLYDQKGEKDKQRQTLTDLVSLGIDSPFSKEAAAKLKTPDVKG